MKGSSFLCGGIILVKLQRRLNAVSNVKLLHDVRHVIFYGSVGALEASRDLFVGHALRDKREDFPLTKIKCTLIIVRDYFDPLALVDQQSRREVRRHIAVASKDSSHGLDQLLSAAALQNVTPRTCLQRRGNVLLVFGSRQRDDSHVWTSAGNARGRAGAASWEIEIQQHDVRNALLCYRYSVSRRRTLPHNLNSIGLC